GAVERWDPVAQLELHLALEDHPRQREAVGVEAARGDADDPIALAGAAAIEQPAALDHADREAGEVILAGRVHARHLRRLPAEERAPRLLAALGDASDHGLGEIDVELAGREV